MRVLALDTATGATAVALADPADPEHALEARDDPPAGARPGHAAQLLGLVERVLRPAGGWTAVDRIAVGIGPGTFTGLRIGIATAHALARARELPLVGISTLAALALRVEDPGRGRLALIDARRGEVFAAGWSAGGDVRRGPPALVPCVLAPNRLAEVVAALGPDPVAVGDGALKFAEMLQRAGAVLPAADSPLHRVSAIAHCELAAVAAVPDDPVAVQPQYLRAPDARARA